MYKFLSKGQNKTVLLHLYSGELDKIVGEREAKATRWGGGDAMIIGKLGKLGKLGNLRSLAIGFLGSLNSLNSLSSLHSLKGLERSQQV